MGDQFETEGAAQTNPYFEPSNNNKTLTINTGNAPANLFEIIQRSNSEPLTFGVGPSTSGVGTVSITGTGDAVTFNAVNITGSLTDTSGSITVSAPLTTGGSVSLTGSGVGSGTTNNWGVKIASTITVAGSSAISITGTGSSNGSGHNYGVVDTTALTAGGSLTISGTGQGGGTSNWGVKLEGSVTAGSSGAVTINGIGSGSGSGYDSGVTVAAAVSAGGSVTITGSGQGTGNGNFGILVSSSITAGSSGSITITGNGNSRSYEQGYGVELSGALSAGGSISITGTGYGVSGHSWGVEDSSPITAGSSGSITITGSGYGFFDDYGVRLGGQLSAGGSITITGTGQGLYAENNFGVQLGNSIQSGDNILVTGSGSYKGDGNSYGVQVSGEVSAGGTITIIGTGNGIGKDQGNSNDGVILKGSAARVSTVNGALSITGVCASTYSNNNVGVYIYQGASVLATGTGAITITGTGGQGSSNNQIGIFITGSGTTVTGSAGGITLHGTGRVGGSDDYGVAVEKGALLQDTSTGAVSLVGIAPNGTAAIFFDTSNGSKLKAATGNVCLTGNLISLGDPNSIVSTTTTSTSHLYFQSASSGRAIVLGGSRNTANALTFTSTDLAAIAQGGSNHGFGLIVLGSSAGVNPMSFAGALSFSTSLSLVARGGLSVKIPDAPYPAPAAAMLVVEGTLNLNSDPLHLIAPAAPPKVGLITLFHTTQGMNGSTFLALPQGSYVTDTAGNDYILSYEGNEGTDLTLTSIGGRLSPGAGSGRGRG